MKQVDDSKRFPLLSGKSPEEIVKLFNSYNFVDDHGHRLDVCQDFKDLVELASHARQRQESNLASNLQGYRNPLSFSFLANK